MQFAACVEVDNSKEDPIEGAKGLRDELLPVLRSMAGFVRADLLTAYDCGRGMAVVVFDTREQAESLIVGLTVGAQLRDGVTVVSRGVFEVTASTR